MSLSITQSTVLEQLDALADDYIRARGQAERLMIANEMAHMAHMLIAVDEEE